MDRIRITGGKPLNGTIPISGAKNATLPLMIASLLTEDTLVLDKVPHLADVVQLQRILNNHGVDVMLSGKRAHTAENSGQTVKISAANIVDTTAPYELVSKMRASFWVLAPLLARKGVARVSLPGGCAIGTRPVDLLIMAMEKLGAKIEIEAGYVVAQAPKGLQGGEIKFSKVTVGGTHMALMAASLANGTTVIENAAREPEVTDVADCLVKMGAKISGIGTSRLVVEGVSKLNGARHRVLPDRIETGTYAFAVAMTGGDVTLAGARPDLLQSALDVLEQTGAKVTSSNEGIRIQRNGAGLAPVKVTTEPFPGFQRNLADHRDDFRKPLHARAGTRPPRRPHFARWADGDDRRGGKAHGRAGDGDRPESVGVARDRSSCCRRRHLRQPRLSPRSRLRAAGRKTQPLRRRYRAVEQLNFLARVLRAGSGLPNYG
jgi:UDP-N-acetylglucosamine 1-carboxyvinyltransferase